MNRNSACKTGFDTCKRHWILFCMVAITLFWGVEDLSLIGVIVNWKSEYIASSLRWQVSGFWYWAMPSLIWKGINYFGAVPVLTICFRLFQISHGRDVLFQCRDVRMHRIRFTGYRNMGRHSGPPCPSWWLSGRPLFCIKGLVIHTYISTYIDLEWFVDTLFRFHLFRIAWYIDMHHDRMTL